SGNRGSAGVSFAAKRDTFRGPANRMIVDPSPCPQSRLMTARKTADLPLHSGAAPAWLFRRMVDMAGAIGTLIVRESGPQELLRRLSDPFWFQAFGCVLGFDWHSSGVATTVCGALKEAAERCGNDLG